MPRAGASGKSIGSVAASMAPMILAIGSDPTPLAAASDARTTAAPPSFNVDALPAVIVPFSF